MEQGHKKEREGTSVHEKRCDTIGKVYKKKMRLAKEQKRSEEKVGFKTEHTVVFQKVGSVRKGKWVNKVRGKQGMVPKGSEYERVQKDSRVKKE